NSSLGRLRYYNTSDMVLTVDDTGMSAASGYFNPVQTTIPPNELTNFISTTSSFWDQREGKTVKPIDINIQKFTAWDVTNSHLPNLNSIYVVDNRTTLSSSQLGAVRVFNGATLPGGGLTVATGRPLYVQGDYNQPNSAFLGTTNTSNTSAASLVADAVTFLSDAWIDGNSANNRTGSGNGPTAANTTVNAAILTGVVETAPQPSPLSGYSGGMENFPRFLEAWGSTHTNTYNGSMIKMFPSQYATGPWGKGNVYDPPVRNWN